MSSILYNGKSYKNIILKISVKAPFREILKKINELVLPCSAMSSEPIRFAILELVNNSIRAHRENGSDQDIQLEFRLIADTLNIVLKDAGGGFDTAALPYDLSASPESIDVNSFAFQEYREKNSYQRFGMGLLAVKKVFDTCEILFYDQENNTGPWTRGKTQGTIIKMTYREIHNE